MAKRRKKSEIESRPKPGYHDLLSGISDLLERVRRMSVRSVNSILTSAYWDVGRRIVEYEQGGKSRAGYGEWLLLTLARDLTLRHGRGFSDRNLRQMRAFYLGWDIVSTASGELEARVRDGPESPLGRFGRHCLPNLSRRGIPLASRRRENGRHRLPNHRLPWSFGSRMQFQLRHTPASSRSPGPTTSG